jgi:quercetin dioxygenase-like cupin family protein
VDVGKIAIIYTVFAGHFRIANQETPMKFSVSHAVDAVFEKKGLRNFFAYRDLGIREASNGKMQAHVIRAIPGATATGERHHHRLECQIIYCLKGWIRFHYEGIGEVLLVPGTCVHQPPGIRHSELGHSDDLELLEIVMPPDFETVSDET